MILLRGLVLSSLRPCLLHVNQRTPPTPRGGPLRFLLFRSKKCEDAAGGHNLFCSYAYQSVLEICEPTSFQHVKPPRPVLEKQESKIFTYKVKPCHNICIWPSCLLASCRYILSAAVWTAQYHWFSLTVNGTLPVAAGQHVDGGGGSVSC